MTMMSSFLMRAPNLIILNDEILFYIAQDFIVQG